MARLFGGGDTDRLLVDRRAAPIERCFFLGRRGVIGGYGYLAIASLAVRLARASVFARVCGRQPHGPVAPSLRGEHRRAIGLSRSPTERLLHLGISLAVCLYLGCMEGVRTG